MHVGNAGYIPFRDVTVERFRTPEHAVHVSHAGHIPVRDVAAYTHTHTHTHSMASK